MEKMFTLSCLSKSLKCYNFNYTTIYALDKNKSVPNSMRFKREELRCLIFVFIALLINTYLFIALVEFNFPNEYDPSLNSNIISNQTKFGSSPISLKKLPAFASDYSEFFFGAILQRNKCSSYLTLSIFTLNHKVLSSTSSEAGALKIEEKKILEWEKAEAASTKTRYSSNGSRVYTSDIDKIYCLIKYSKYFHDTEYRTDIQYIPSNHSSDSDMNYKIDIMQSNIKFMDINTTLKAIYNSNVNDFMTIRIMRHTHELIKFRLPWRTRKTGYMLTYPHKLDHQSTPDIMSLLFNHQSPSPPPAMYTSPLIVNSRYNFWNINPFYQLLNDSICNISDVDVFKTFTSSDNNLLNLQYRSMTESNNSFDDGNADSQAFTTLNSIRNVLDIYKPPLHQYDLNYLPITGSKTNGDTVTLDTKTFNPSSMVLCVGLLNAPLSSIVLTPLLESLQHHYNIGITHIFLLVSYSYHSKYMSQLCFILRQYIHQGLLSVISSAGDMLDRVSSTKGMVWGDIFLRNYFQTVYLFLLKSNDERYISYLSLSDFIIPTLSNDVNNEKDKNSNRDTIKDDKTSTTSGNSMQSATKRVHKDSGEDRYAHVVSGRSVDLGKEADGGRGKEEDVTTSRSELHRVFATLSSILSRVHNTGSANGSYDNSSGDSSSDISSKDGSEVNRLRDSHNEANASSTILHSNAHTQASSDDMSICYIYQLPIRTIIRDDSAYHVYAKHNKGNVVSYSRGNHPDYNDNFNDDNVEPEQGMVKEQGKYTGDGVYVGSQAILNSVNSAASDADGHGRTTHSKNLRTRSDHKQDDNVEPNDMPDTTRKRHSYMYNDNQIPFAWLKVQFQFHYFLEYATWVNSVGGGSSPTDLSKSENSNSLGDQSHAGATEEAMPSYPYGHFAHIYDLDHPNTRHAAMPYGHELLTFQSIDEKLAAGRRGGSHCYVVPLHNYSRNGLSSMYHNSSDSTNNGVEIRPSHISSLQKELENVMSVYHYDIYLSQSDGRNGEREEAKGGHGGLGMNEGGSDKTQGRSYSHLDIFRKEPADSNIDSDSHGRKGYGKNLKYAGKYYNLTKPINLYHEHYSKAVYKKLIEYNFDLVLFANLPLESIPEAFPSEYWPKYKSKYLRNVEKYNNFNF